MKISFVLADITGKDADDIALQVVIYLKESGYDVTDFYIEIEGQR